MGIPIPDTPFRPWNSAKGATVPGNKFRPPPVFGHRVDGQPSLQRTTMHRSVLPDKAGDHHPGLCGQYGTFLAGTRSEGYTPQVVAPPPVSPESVEYRFTGRFATNCDGMMNKAVPECRAGNTAGSPPSASEPGGGRHGKRKGCDLAFRLRNHREEILLLTRNPPIPATDNEAEKDLRMLTVNRKMSGGDRNRWKARNRAETGILTETARRQGLNVPGTIPTEPEDPILQMYRFVKKFRS